MKCVAIFSGTWNIHKAHDKDSDMSQHKQSGETLKYP